MERTVGRDPRLHPGPSTGVDTDSPSRSGPVRVVWRTTPRSELGRHTSTDLRPERVDYSPRRLPPRTSDKEVRVATPPRGAPLPLVDPHTLTHTNRNAPPEGSDRRPVYLPVSTGTWVRDPEDLPRLLPSTLRTPASRLRTGTGDTVEPDPPSPCRQSSQEIK